MLCSFISVLSNQNEETSQKPDAANWLKLDIAAGSLGRKSVLFSAYFFRYVRLIRNSFRSVFLNNFLEKALRTTCAVKDLLRNTCRRVGYFLKITSESLGLLTQFAKK